MPSSPAWPSPALTRIHLLPRFAALALAAAGCRTGASPATLPPIPWPPAIEIGEPAVREHLTTLRDRIDELGATQDVDPLALSVAYGEAGQALMAYEAWDGARVAFGNAVALDDEDPRWPYYIALMDFEANDLDAAEAGFRKALKLQPDDPAAEIHLVRVLRLREAYDDMTRRLWRLLEHPQIGANEAVVRYLLGEEALRLGQPRDAVMMLEQVVAMDPGAGQAHARLAEAYRQVGDEARAKLHADRINDETVALSDPLQQELRELSRSSITWVERAERFEAQGRLVEAEALFDRALVLNPAQVLTSVKLGRVQVKLKDAEAAIKTLEGALARAGAAGADAGGDALGSANLASLHRWLAEARFLKGEPATALAEVDKALALQPGSGEALATKANLLRRSGDCGLAAEAFRAAVAAVPDRGVLRVQAAMCALKLGDEPGAMAIIDEGLAALPEDPDLQDAKARLLAAAVGDGLRDGEAAWALAERNLDQRRGVDTLETAAMAQAERGHFDEAIRLQSEAIQLAKEQKRDAWLATLQAGILHYQGRRPARGPWPEFIYGQ